MYKKISDYGVIGDMNAVALVSNDGSIDYCCMPHIDSPTVFASLLDDEKGGMFSIRPRIPYSSEQHYIKNTNILTCIFSTKTGKAELIDFMPVQKQSLYVEKEHTIHRCLKVIKGSVDFIITFSPRPQYALGKPVLKKEDNKIITRLGDEIFTLFIHVKKHTILDMNNGVIVIHITLGQDEDAHFDFIYGNKEVSETETCTFQETNEYWIEWIESSVKDRYELWDGYSEMINRSSLVLKLLTFQPTGAIAAAATTSLPEAIGAERNWDYRFTWIRDASFTLKAFFALGYVEEADSFIRWLHSTYRRFGSNNLQIMYSLEGESELKEHTLDHLKGYRNSKPVRIGNGAYNQRQWDIYGEVLDSALRLSDYAGKIDETLWPFFMDVCSLAIRNWDTLDEGIWEVRNGPFHFTYSKAMCWVALDRGITIAKRYGFQAPLKEWITQRDLIKKDILEKGFNKEFGSFVQRYGSKDLDSSLLLLGLMKFLPIDDVRFQGTIQACQKHLLKDGFLLRYSASDGLEGEEGAFILCNFWLIECLALSGKVNEAKNLLETTMKAANHLGLFSEEYNPKTGEMLGNFPQAFSHIGFINAVAAISNIQEKLSRHRASPSLRDRIKKFIPHKVTLNETDTTFDDTSKTIATQLKVSLNNLQGAFFNVLESRVNYNAMKKSQNFKKYLLLTKKLNAFNPYTLGSDEEKMAFWINIYNILIIHGVLHFDIKRTVKEVVSFFARIGYMIGDLFFSPDDIEHGILRSNLPHPRTEKKQFDSGDPRNALLINSFDYRIHFALVCASSSCPPIEFYDADNIDYQLDLAGRSFIERNGLVINEKENIVYLSQIFKWYGSDFGENPTQVVKKAALFADQTTKKYIEKHIAHAEIKYMPYNWNLNSALK